MPGKNHVDLAILDIKLKKMSGIQVLEQLKKHQPRDEGHHAHRLPDH